MHFLIVGPGAMGCLFAARLKTAGFEVTLFDYRSERARRIGTHGISVIGVSGEYHVQVAAETAAPPTAPDIVIICVKSYQTRSAALNLQPHLPPSAAVVTLQNGVGNIETLQEVLGADRVYAGVTAEGATLLADGQIRHAGQGETLVGPAGGTLEGAQNIADALVRAGFNARCAENVTRLIWGKLIINVGINALTAITRLKNGRLPEYDGSRRVMAAAVKEAAAVAAALGIDLPYPDPVARVLEVCRATAGNIASMLQDVRQQRPTEVADINGAVVREGIRVNIPTPVNFTLTALVETLQQSYAERLS